MPYKLVSKNIFNKKQLNKTVYSTKKDYLRYKDEWSVRARQWSNVEHYELVDEEWKLIETEMHICSGDCENCSCKSFCKERSRK